MGGFTVYVNPSSTEVFAAGATFAYVDGDNDSDLHIAGNYEIQLEVGKNRSIEKFIAN